MSVHPRKRRLFSAEDVIEFREMWRRGASLDDLEDHAGVQKAAIIDLLLGRSYRDAPCPITVAEWLIRKPQDRALSQQKRAVRMQIGRL